MELFAARWYGHLLAASSLQEGTEMDYVRPHATIDLIPTLIASKTICGHAHRKGRLEAAENNFQERPSNNRVHSLDR